MWLSIFHIATGGYTLKFSKTERIKNMRCKKYRNEATHKFYQWFSSLPIKIGTSLVCDLTRAVASDTLEKNIHYFMPFFTFFDELLSFACTSCKNQATQDRSQKYPERPKLLLFEIFISWTIFNPIIPSFLSTSKGNRTLCRRAPELPYKGSSSGQYLRQSRKFSVLFCW